MNDIGIMLVQEMYQEVDLCTKYIHLLIDTVYRAGSQNFILHVTDNETDMNRLRDLFK